MLWSISSTLLLIVFISTQIIISGEELYGRSSNRIRPIAVEINPAKQRYEFSNDYNKERYKLLHEREKSSTYIQSRRFHPDQFKRDLRDLGQPASFQSQISSSYYQTFSGVDANTFLSSQEGCRLTNAVCSGDHQCCSGKCRCMRWSVMGKMSCLKKCF